MLIPHMGKGFFYLFLSSIAIGKEVWAIIFAIVLAGAAVMHFACVLNPTTPKEENKSEKTVSNNKVGNANINSIENAESFAEDEVKIDIQPKMSFSKGAYGNNNAYDDE
eukprot:CAMPEP_0114652640 /NCGR_PEP_ID=MMETSP0191-20121206/9155_1 /TAXON_ID=126664 /ORGANISM="Sorites sp." /LENGTH=108 /DNA_ID=CAMNT_0001867275 /DNA_START=132 /DNA_END=458 /DNA_ORIENTATION=-